MLTIIFIIYILTIMSQTMPTIHTIKKYFDLVTSFDLTLTLTFT